MQLCRLVQNRSKKSAKLGTDICQSVSLTFFLHLLGPKYVV